MYKHINIYYILNIYILNKNNKYYIYKININITSLSRTVASTSTNKGARLFGESGLHISSNQSGLI